MKYLKAYKLFESESLSDLRYTDFPQLETIIEEMLGNLTDDGFRVDCDSYIETEGELTGMKFTSSREVKILAVEISKPLKIMPDGYEHSPFKKEECINDIKEFIDRMSDDFKVHQFLVSDKLNNSWSSDINKLYEPTDRSINYIRIEFI